MALEGFLIRTFKKTNAFFGNKDLKKCLEIATA